MNTLKNAALLVVMGGVLYFVYVATAKKPHHAPSSLALHGESTAPPSIEVPDPHAHTAPLTPPAGGFASPAPPAPQLPPPPTFPALPPGGIDVPPPLPQPVAPAIPEYTPPVVDHAPPAAPPTYAQETPPAAPGRSVYEVQPPEAQPQPTAPPIQPVTNVAPATNRSLTEFALQQDFQAAQDLIQTGRFRDALAKLSPHAKQHDLSKADRETLFRWLDALAAKVIYSPEHFLAEPYAARSSETLITISSQYKIPWQLLQNINQVRDPQVLVNGTVLKVVPGPFRAEIDLSRNLTTIYLNELYAGRFACTVGDEAPSEGVFAIKDKSRDRAYFGRNGASLPGNDPANPYGGWWLDLGGTACLHGSPTAGHTTGLGCISYSPQDAKDIYGILSVGSQVSIKK